MMILLLEHLPTERKGEVRAACKCQFTNCRPYINQAAGNRLLVVESDGIIYVWYKVGPLPDITWVITPVINYKAIYRDYNSIYNWQGPIL